MNSALGFWDMYKGSDEGKRIIGIFDTLPLLEAAEKKEFTDKDFYNWAKGVFDFATEKVPELFPKSYKTDFAASYANDIVNISYD